MRTLYEILETTKDNKQAPTYDECYYSMLVLNGLMNMAMSDINTLSGESSSRLRIGLHAEEAHHRYKVALNTDPKSYLGDDIPGNPRHDQFRSLGNRLLDLFLNEPTLRPEGILVHPKDYEDISRILEEQRQGIIEEMWDIIEDDDIDESDFS